jgi:NAD+ synthase
MLRSSYGREAIECCEQLQPDVILMDLVMPELGGVAATRTIHQRWPHVQVIALTSFREKQLVQDALLADAIGYLLKNVTGDELAESIRQAHRGRPTHAPAVRLDQHERQFDAAVYAERARLIYRQGEWNPAAEAAASCYAFSYDESMKEKRHPFRSGMTMMRELDIPETAKQLEAFVKTAVATAGFGHVVLAVSGGIDSATAAALAAAALGPEHVFALLLPYKDWHAAAEQRAWQQLRKLQIPEAHVQRVDLAPIVEGFLRAINPPDPALASGAPGTDADRVRLGNVMARARMVVLFDYAKSLKALVLGTENKSEHYLGYYTRFGDEASDIEPLRNLYKTEIYQLAKHLAVPQSILEAVPSADLWSGQTDEGQFGFTYRAADEILYGLYEAHQSPEALVDGGLDQHTVDAVRAWAEGVAFKHHLPLIAPEPVLAQV